MLELFSLVMLLTIFGLMATLIFKGPKKAPATVLPFRTYHRIDWLRKRRAAKFKHKLGVK